MVIRLLAALRTSRVSLTATASWLADAAEVTLTAITHHGQRRPWDEDNDEFGPDIPAPRTPAD